MKVASTKHEIQITNDGKFTCNACIIHNDGYNTYVTECPEFDTIEELVRWVKEESNG